MPSSVTAASVFPFGEKASDLTSPPVSTRGGPDGRDFAGVPERDAPLPETDRDQPAVELNSPGWPSNPVEENRPSFVKVKGRPRPRSPVRSQAIAEPS